MATFTQYAIAAAQEALDDACWMPKTEEERQMTVCTPFLFWGENTHHWVCV
jgi:hypothetical protein